MNELLLASASPRRCALLEQIGVSFTVQSADIDETIDPQQGGAEFWTVHLAEQKALAVQKARNCTTQVILAADTMVVCDGTILGKPASELENQAFLRLLSGRVHEVVTGFCLLHTANGQMYREWVKTKVFFRSLSEAEMAAYVASGEGKDKAGGYGIQGKGALFVEKIEGCYFNVVGLPLAAVGLGLRRMGILVLGA